MFTTRRLPGVEGARELSRMTRFPMIPVRGRWPLILLLAGIAIMGAVALQAHRATRSQKVVMQRVLDDYAKFARWSYARHLEELMSGAAREILGPVNHGPGVHTSRDIPHAADVAQYLPFDASCFCHVPRYGPIPDILVSFTLSVDTTAVAYNERRNSTDGWFIERENEARAASPELARSYAWVNDSVTRRVRSGFRSTTGFPYIISRSERGTSLVAYTLMPTVWGDTIVYAAEYSERALVNGLESVLDRKDLLPPSLTDGLDNRSVLVLEVASPDGRPIYRSDFLPDGWKREPRVSLPDDYGGLVIRAQIRPALANALVIGGTPRSQLPLLYGLLALAAALTIVAVGQIGRETALMRERAGFVASVSHELRTPLAQVRLFVDTLRHGRADTPESRDWSVNQIDRETRRLVHLVDNVLLFSRGVDTLLESPHASIDIAGEVRTVVGEFAPLAASRRVTFDIDAPASTIVRTSRDALRHMLLNLLDNAVKYGPNGQTVRVSVQCDDDSCSISVADQGPGIAADAARIWEPFYRGRGASAAAVGGSGIGLHLVRTLARGLGGDAMATSTPTGSTFRIRLPVRSGASA